jgi:hypothetical protein
MQIHEYYKNLSLDDLEGEVWESIPEFDRYYEASNLGRIKSIYRIILRSDGSELPIYPRILRQALKKKAKRSKYLFVVCRKDGSSYTREVHRLVAATFKNIGNGFIVHENYNTLDNRAVNLLEKSPKEKCKRIWDAGFQTSGSKGRFGTDSLAAKPILLKDKNETFGSRVEAAKWLIRENIAPNQPLENIISSINKSAKGVYNRSYGFKWANIE